MVPVHSSIINLSTLCTGLRQVLEVELVASLSVDPTGQPVSWAELAQQWNASEKCFQFGSVNLKTTKQ